MRDEVNFAFDSSTQHLRNGRRRDRGLLQVDFHRLAFLVLMGLRAAFGVGIATLVYRQPSIFRLIPFFSWLLILAVEKGTLPLVGQLLGVGPSMVAATIIVYIAAAICGAYSARGSYLYLSGVLIFLFGFVGSWPNTSGLSTLLLFFPGALVILEYTNLGGNLLIRDPLIIGNALALLLWLSASLCIMSSLVLPLFASVLVKKKLISTASLCAALSRSQRQEARAHYAHAASIKALCSEIEASLEFIKECLPLVQVEFFFADVSGYTARYTLLCHAFAALTQTSPGVSDEEDAVFLDAFMGMAGDDLPAVTGGTLLKRVLQSYQALPWWKWKPSMLKFWLRRFLDFWWPRSECFESTREYLASFEFKKRLLNAVLAGSALTFASLFVLIKSWKDFFFHPTWPAIVVAFVYNHGLDLKHSGNRLLGTVIGGMLTYAILLIGDIHLFDYTKFSGILVALVFLFRVIYGRNPTLSSTCFLVTTLILFEPLLFAVGDREKWVFERLFLNFLGVVIMLFFQLVAYLVYLPAWQVKQYMLLSMETLLQILQNSEHPRSDALFQKKIQILDARLEQLELVLESAADVPLFIHHDLRVAECVDTLQSLRQLRQAVALERYEREPFNAAAPCAMIMWAQEALKHGITGESVRTEQFHPHDYLGVAAARTMHSVLELVARSHKLPELKQIAGSRPFGDTFLETVED